MSGAAILCATSALRGGAGLVKVAVPAEILPIVAAGNPCYMTVRGSSRMRTAGSGPGPLSTLTNLCAADDVIAVGPGLGRSAEVTALLIELVEKVAKPMVIDADGLNALAGNTDALGVAKSPRIITPHPGEFARLLQTDVKTVQADRQKLAADFAGQHNLIVVLKGEGTIVTDGQRVYRNTTGNPGMATGGSGDVLTGLIAAFLGQHLPAFEAAQLAVHLHGLAGDLARDQIAASVGLIATDLLDFLPPCDSPHSEPSFVREPV